MEQPTANQAEQRRFLQVAELRRLRNLQFAAKPVAKTVNVNTATAKELDSLPSVGAARSKSILAERAKGSFKDWPDFDKRMTGTNVNAGVKKKIKDLVTF